MNRHTTTAGALHFDVGQGNGKRPHNKLWSELRRHGTVTLLQGPAYPAIHALVDFLPPEPLSFDGFDLAAPSVQAMQAERVTYANMPRDLFACHLRVMAWRAFHVWHSALTRCAHVQAVDRTGQMPAAARALRTTNLRTWQDHTLVEYRRTATPTRAALDDYRARWAAGPGAVSNLLSKDPHVEPDAADFEAFDDALERLVATHIGVLS